MNLREMRGLRPLFITRVRTVTRAYNSLKVPSNRDYSPENKKFTTFSMERVVFGLSVSRDPFFKKLPFPSITEELKILLYLFWV